MKAVNPICSAPDVWDIVFSSAKWFWPTEQKQNKNWLEHKLTAMRHNWIMCWSNVTLSTLSDVDFQDFGLWLTTGDSPTSLISSDSHSGTIETGLKRQSDPSRINDTAHRWSHWTRVVQFSRSFTEEEMRDYFAPNPWWKVRVAEIIGTYWLGAEFLPQPEAAGCSGFGCARYLAFRWTSPTTWHKEKSQTLWQLG